MIKNMFWSGGSYRTGVKPFDNGCLRKYLSQRNSAVVAAQFFPSEKIRIDYE